MQHLSLRQLFITNPSRSIGRKKSVDFIFLNFRDNFIISGTYSNYWCEKARKHMCVIDRHEMTLAVKYTIPTMCEKAHENIVDLGEIAGNQHLLYFRHNIFLLHQRQILLLLSHLNCVLDAHAFNLDKSTCIPSLNSKDGAKIYYPSSTCTL